MNLRIQQQIRRAPIAAMAVVIFLGASPSFASDHLDTRTVIADPRADIGDLYAWSSYDGKRLNLVMTIVGHSFSNDLRYIFHVDSGKRFGQIRATTAIECWFPSGKLVDCWAGEADSAHGDASEPHGLESRKHQFRVFAGLRDDPFFNNVKGSRDAYQQAAGSLKQGAAVDAAGCPHFDATTSQAILDKWHHTDGGPATDFLKGWTPASLVVSIDLDAVNKGGTMLAVWAATATVHKQLDRMGRPLTGNALLAPLAPDEVSDKLKEQYNRTSPSTSKRFIPEIEKTLALYDSFDGKCANQLLTDASKESPQRYRQLATVLADDRLWVDSESTICTQFFAVELANLSGQSLARIDCGGRTPNEDAVDVYRSLLANGAVTGVDDGVDHDEKEHSTSAFPFLASP